MRQMCCRSVRAASVRWQLGGESTAGSSVLTNDPTWSCANYLAMSKFIHPQKWSLFSCRKSFMLCRQITAYKMCLPYYSPEERRRKEGNVRIIALDIWFLISDIIKANSGLLHLRFLRTQ